MHSTKKDEGYTADHNYQQKGNDGDHGTSI